MEKATKQAEPIESQSTIDAVQELQGFTASIIADIEARLRPVLGNLLSESKDVPTDRHLWSVMHTQDSLNNRLRDLRDNIIL
jgi:hypothetical protein